MSHDERPSRATRSRSRSMAPPAPVAQNHQQQPQPQLLAANGKHASTSSSSASPSSQKRSVDVPAAAAAAADSGAASASASSAAPAPETAALLAKMFKVPTGVGRKDGSRRPHTEQAEFFWCDGEPTLRKVSAHLDTLTASEVQLRAAHSSLAESFAAMNDTMASLLDSNTRLRRELRAQKLTSQRRLLWGGGFLVFAATFGFEALRYVALALVAFFENPQAAWPLFVVNVSHWTFLLWLLAPFLTLALFVHSMANAYAHGRLALGRTLAALLAGVAMQVPMLWFLYKLGLQLLTYVAQNPLFESSSDMAWANQAVAIGVWVAVALFDYMLIVLHGYMH